MKKEGLLKGDQSESQESKANRLEIPEDDFYSIVDQLNRVGIDPPELDVFASVSNTCCTYFIDKEKDAFQSEFLIEELSRGVINQRVPNTIYCNAQHKEYKVALYRVHEQYLKHDFNAVVLIPANNIRTKYWNELVERNRIDVNPDGYCFYFPYNKPLYFELDGLVLRDKKGRKQHAINAYNILLFVKKSNIKKFKANISRLYSQ